MVWFESCPRWIVVARSETARLVSLRNLELLPDGQVLGSRSAAARLRARAGIGSWHRRRPPRHRSGRVSRRSNQCRAIGGPTTRRQPGATQRQLDRARPCLRSASGSPRRRRADWEGPRHPRPAKLDAMSRKSTPWAASGHCIRIPTRPRGPPAIVIPHPTGRRMAEGTRPAHWTAETCRRPMDPYETYVRHALPTGGSPALSGARRPSRVVEAIHDPPPPGDVLDVRFVAVH